MFGRPEPRLSPEGLRRVRRPRAARAAARAPSRRRRTGGAAPAPSSLRRLRAPRPRQAAPPRDLRGPAGGSARPSAARPSARWRGRSATCSSACGVAQRGRPEAFRREADATLRRCRSATPDAARAARRADPAVLPRRPSRRRRRCRPIPRPRPRGCPLPPAAAGLAVLVRRRGGRRRAARPRPGRGPAARSSRPRRVPRRPRPCSGPDEFVVVAVDFVPRMADRAALRARWWPGRASATSRSIAPAVSPPTALQARVEFDEY